MESILAYHKPFFDLLHDANGLHIALILHAARYVNPRPSMTVKDISKYSELNESTVRKRLYTLEDGNLVGRTSILSKGRAVLDFDVTEKWTDNMSLLGLDEKIKSYIEKERT